MLTEAILVVAYTVVWSRLKITKHVSQFLVTFIELFRDSNFPGYHEGTCNSITILIFTLMIFYYHINSNKQPPRHNCMELRSRNEFKESCMEDMCLPPPPPTHLKVSFQL